MSDDASLGAAIRDRGMKVQSLINSRKAPDAALLSLENPPILSKNAQIKQQNAEVVFQALKACTKTERQKLIASLQPEAQDVLMKYIYKGLSMPQYCAFLFDWHAELAQKAGIGCTVRAMTDRKTV